ncbi:MAG: YraN family protein [Deltaproteobacteria bacterium RBG_16_54_11]|nr:MAG: YraN family protein [Deltaproteobacteria bacterium RBG_16_54_11]
MGSRGEDLAVQYLKKRGFKVIERNYHCQWGEIDLIAREKNTLVFIEIKARSSSEYGLPQEAVDRFKQKKLIEVARYYLAERHLTEDIPARFDVVAIHLTPAGPQIELIKDAFQEK